jgi:hypothetical protein
MSKQLVVTRKRKGRPGAKITEKEINGVLTAGKECAKCGAWKPLNEFHKKRDGVGGRESACKSCRTVSTRRCAELEVRTINGEFITGKKCTKCGEWKPLETGFHRSAEGLGGKKSVCKECLSLGRKSLKRSDA